MDHVVLISLTKVIGIYSTKEISMSISHMKNGLVAGVLLGTGCLRRDRNDIGFQHILPHLNYLKFKLRLMSQVGFSCKLFKLTKVRTNLGVYDCCSGTATDSYVRRYHRYSLVELLQELNPLGLMIWWLDYGCLVVHKKTNGSISRFGYLNTRDYNLEENQLIQQALLDKFGIEATLHTDSHPGFTKPDHWRIYLNATNMKRLIDLVREFIPWCPKDMLYKFNMQYVVNNKHDSLEIATHYNF